MDKILYSPKEGTTGFWGLRDVPKEPDYCTDFGDVILVCESSFCKCKGMLKNHNAALESCKEKKLEIIVNDEDCILVTCGKNAGFAGGAFFVEGQIYDLPIGYEFKEGYQYHSSKKHYSDAGWVDCTESQYNSFVELKFGMPRKVLRLVKTDMKDLLSVLNKKADQLDSEHRARTTFTADQLQVKVGPQPEPEESQMSKFSHSEIGSHHWAATLLSYIMRVGEYLEDHERTGDAERKHYPDWGREIKQRATEVNNYLQSKPDIQIKKQ